MDLVSVLVIFLSSVVQEGVNPLSCFVGLGNRSARDRQPVIACPEVMKFDNQSMKKQDQTSTRCDNI